MLDREQLQQRQYSLVHALVGEGPAPDGFPLHRLALVRQGLAIKRRREALSSWPGLEKRLGESVYSLFDQYAAARPRPAGGCPKLDGYQFCGWLSQQQIGVGTDIVARFEPTPGGLRARHPVVTKLWLLGHWCYSLRRPFMASYRGILAGAPSFR